MTNCVVQQLCTVWEPEGANKKDECVKRIGELDQSWHHKQNGICINYLEAAVVML